jgi:chromatin assembly factor 1 subunit A
LTSVEIVSSNTLDNANASTPNANPTPGSATRPAKRRKLTPAEKEQQKKDKEAKDAEKALQKATKEEEKRVKDEEKRKKAEEREAKKREKEVAEEQKVQEKLKKDRSQMRLGVWFQKPATPANATEDGEAPMSTARRKSLSLEPFDAVADQIRQSQSPCKGAAPAATLPNTPAKPPVSDYHKYFLPFQLQTHCTMAPSHVIDDPEQAQEAFDHDIADPSLQEKYDLGLVESYASLERQFSQELTLARGQPVLSARELVDQIQGTLQQPVDLTEDDTPANPMAALQALSRRYLEFQVDVRPPYFGTYTKIRSPRTVAKLRRNPFTRARKDTDYDYDSEAEWEEPEEGDDDCNDDEEETESQADAGEMDEFLDDEEEGVKAKRKMVTGDLMPASTGLCWENASGEILPSLEGAESAQSLLDMRIGVLLPAFTGATIDPLSTKYWEQDSVPQPKLVVTEGPSSTAPMGLMAPPRAPLQPRPNTNGTLDKLLVGAAEGMKGPITSTATTQGSKGKPKAPPKVLSKEDLDEFKDAVVGSQLGKAELLKGLKSRCDLQDLMSLCYG